MFSFCVITSSDKGFKGEREDTSGRWIIDFLSEKGFSLSKYIVLPDEKEMLKKEMLHMCDELLVNLVVTTGGTGFSPRDVTPEATIEVVERQTPGVSEAMRANSMLITKRAMLSRAVSGIRGKTLIINLPGSKKAVEESLTFIFESIFHGLEILNNISGDCGRI